VLAGSPYVIQEKAATKRKGNSVGHSGAHRIDCAADAAWRELDASLSFKILLKMLVPFLISISLLSCYFCSVCKWIILFNTFLLIIFSFFICHFLFITLSFFLNYYHYLSLLFPFLFLMLTNPFITTFISLHSFHLLLFSSFSFAPFIYFTGFHFSPFSFSSCLHLLLSVFLSFSFYIEF
jgi:hypothetical protein